MEGRGGGTVQGQEGDEGRKARPDAGVEADPGWGMGGALMTGLMMVGLRMEGDSTAGLRAACSAVAAP